ncbi:pyrroloquinoline quinone-dependent dehydrogenase [Candidatus Rariloculus sp.]|uniref:pyrroloquinoline quinone-dependent dehydrogenase n=1 Tax=Candidatus Rariloculus sp. TaxID=3101265 RepID=UPI003D09F057
MLRSGLASIVIATVLAGALPAAAQTTGDFIPVTDAMLQNPDPGDWLTWRRTTNGWGYSPLDQIDRSNVARIEQVWSHPMGEGRQEATPLVYNGVMYVPNRGDYVQAFDAKSGELLWEHQREFPEGVTGGTNRNLAIWGTTLIDAGGDNAMYALDARTGKLLWETQVLEPTARARASSGPIIADGRIITGRQCQPDATHEACVVTAHDAATGKELWRTRTIPRPGEPGDESWGDVPMEQRWHVGTWMVPSFDPELDMIYIGTSVTIPAAKFILGGVDKQHLYHNSTLALDADTGRIVWYYQHLIDHWDLDHPFERLLVDTAVAPDPDQVAWINPRVRAGEERKVITGIPGKTGVVYTLDRETGEFLWARPTLFQNVISDIDGATGAVTVDPERIYTRKDQQLLVCPGMNGGKNWQAGAYSPRTNTMYMPMQNLCMNATTETDERDPELVYGLEAEQRLAPGKEDMGTVWAISAETGATRWHHEQRAGVMSMVATGGGLVFGGDVAGYFKAYDDTSGAVLWEANLGSPVSGFPVTYAVDGKQYVAVTTGPSGVAGNGGRFTPEVMPESEDTAVFVFALP